MTTDEWTEYFKDTGIKKSKDYRDYERGKRMLLVMSLDPVDYERAIKALAKVVGV